MSRFEHEEGTQKAQLIFDRQGNVYGVWNY